ncbi:hypothetical protein ACI7RC_19675 [Brevibacillus sp. B_LB10_24]|uniref:hypothetical protein n=1 Tax=Brevibacillus sp. B_LB10_24 TaxID=3380645 RepID=UPI0038B79CEA
MYKVGIVGPHRSVERILDVSKEFEQGMEFIPHPYQDPREIKTLVLEFNHQVDTWLFSGPVPYLIAKDVLDSDENLVYIPGTESGLYKALLDLTYDQMEILDSVSIDFPRGMYPIDEVLKQLERPPRNIHVPFDLHIDPEELVSYHLDLWKKGKTQGALTALPSICQALKEAGVPASWITTTRSETRQTLKILAEKMRTSYFKDTQIGVEMIEIEHFDRIIQKAKTPYYLQHLELRLKDTLLHLCKKLDGSLTDRGYGRYVIFSSRGAIEREIPMLQNTILQMSTEADTTIAVGIGFGETVLSAEVNAHYAIQQSKEKPKRGIIIVQENGMIIESVGREEKLSYSARTDDKDLFKKLKKGSISAKTFNKIVALIRRMGWNGFTAKDLATHLHMTERHANRIISDLCEVDLAECIGEESQATRGRPSKIYQLK